VTDCFIAPYLLTYLHTHTNTCHIRPSPKIAHRAADAAASSLSPIATIMHVTQLTYWTKPRRHGEEGGLHIETSAFRAAGCVCVCTPCSKYYDISACVQRAWSTCVLPPDNGNSAAAAAAAANGVVRSWLGINASLSYLCNHAKKGQCQSIIFSVA